MVWKYSYFESLCQECLWSINKSVSKSSAHLLPSFVWFAGSDFPLFMPVPVHPWYSTSVACARRECEWGCG